MTDKTIQPREQASKQAQFEECHPNMNLERAADGHYVSGYTQIAWEDWRERPASPVAAPEAPTDELRREALQLADTLKPLANVMLDDAVVGYSWVKRGAEVLKLLASAAPLVPEVAASEQQAKQIDALMAVHDDQLDDYLRGIGIDPAECEAAGRCALDGALKTAATTASQSDADKLLAMRADYDRKEGEARGMLMGRATTASASGEKCECCDGKGGWATAEWTDPVSGPECEGEICTDCNGTGRATAPSRNAALADTDEVPYMIVFDDAARAPELVIGGARARYRYEQISASWNAHLFVKIDSNSRDESRPSAALTQQSAAHAPLDQSFADWLKREMPAGTVIGDPAWWAPRILRAAQASHAGADFHEMKRKIAERIGEGNSMTIYGCAAMSAATEQKEKP